MPTAPAGCQLLREPGNRRCQLSGCLAAARGGHLQTNPAAIPALLKRGQHWRQINLAGAQWHGATMTGKSSGHGVSGMHKPHVSRQPGCGSSGIMAMHQQPTGDKIDLQATCRHRGQHSQKLLRSRLAGFNAEDRAGLLAGPADVGEDVNQQLQGWCVGGGNLTQPSEYHRRPKPPGLGQCSFGCRHPGLQPLFVGIATTGWKGDSGHPQADVIEPFADLADAGVGEIQQLNAMSAVNLDTTNTEFADRIKGSPKVGGQRHQRHTESRQFHSVDHSRGKRQASGTHHAGGVFRGHCQSGSVSCHAMSNVKDVIAALEQLAPPRLAADWDNVGLLVGTTRPTLTRLMTCLTLTPEVAREAVAEQADLIVSHHPLPFRPVKRITDETATGSVLLELLAAGIGVWSGHTAWDSAVGGINALLAETLELEHVSPIEPDEASPDTGFGRMGIVRTGRTVADLARGLTAALGCPGCHVAGDCERPAGRVGIVCGSGGESVAAVAAAGCQTLVTGEIKLHDALAATAHDLAVIAVGHHASERFAMEVLAARLASSLPELHCWASLTETDPLAWLPAAR